MDRVPEPEHDTMIKTRIDDTRMPPAWAAIGAPLIGVPLLVLLLALMAPSGSTDPTEPDERVRAEAVDASSTDRDVQLDALGVDGALREG